MRAVLDLTASSEITSLFEEIQAKATTGVDLSVVEMRVVAERLSTVGRLVVLMEQELAVHRIGEEGRAGRAALEQAATESMTRLTLDPEGKVIRPDFGSKE
ncbi:hypothetical protein CN221_14915 [Sinorhizobium meliloti]|uniref:hypothetical protein n=1 Tax=Rhizobium meliloti TaxID=382 RepID=UPI000FE0EC04|nr:hypothetical protein [Sinorhizobium meliloti]RVG94865.1 hypothetical protein CN221_14915 [Sinorhizobium meliloti]RVH65491.1 hypothetical protein CN209_12855 [Sinorhizobium meliloti]